MVENWHAENTNSTVLTFIKLELKKKKMSIYNKKYVIKYMSGLCCTCMLKHTSSIPYILIISS